MWCWYAKHAPSQSGTQAIKGSPSTGEGHTNGLGAHYVPPSLPVELISNRNGDYLGGHANDRIAALCREKTRVTMLVDAHEAMYAGGQDHNHEWFGGRLCTSLNACWRTSRSWTACRIWNLNGDCLERHAKKGIVAPHWGSVTLAPSIAMLLFDVQVVHAEEQGHNHLWLRGRLCTSLTACRCTSYCGHNYRGKAQDTLLWLTIHAVARSL